MTKKAIVQNAAAVKDTSSANIANNAYTDLLTAANNKLAATHILISNSGAQPLGLFKGASGSEADTGIIIPPSSAPVLVPFECPSGVRLSLKSLGSTQSSGIVCVSFFDGV